MCVCVCLDLHYSCTVPLFLNSSILKTSSFQCVSTRLSDVWLKEEPYKRINTGIVTGRIYLFSRLKNRYSIPTLLPLTSDLKVSVGPGLPDHGICLFFFFFFLIPFFRLSRKGELDKWIKNSINPYFQFFNSSFDEFSFRFKIRWSFSNRLCLLHNLEGSLFSGIFMVSGSKIPGSLCVGSVLVWYLSIPK